MENKLEVRRKAKWQALREAQKKRRAEVRALAEIYGQAETARRIGISRQRVSAILAACP